MQWALHRPTQHLQGFGFRVEGLGVAVMYILALNRDNGKENGNYYIIMGRAAVKELSLSYHINLL